MLWRLLSQRALRCCSGKYENSIDDRFYETENKDDDVCCKCGISKDVKVYYHTVLTMYVTIRYCNHPMCPTCAESICQHHRIFDNVRKAVDETTPLPQDMNNLILSFLDMRENVQATKK